MKVVCAWCGCSMGVKEPLEDDSTTHGMCAECYTKATGRPYTGIILGNKLNEGRPMSPPENILENDAQSSSSEVTGSNIRLESPQTAEDLPAVLEDSEEGEEDAG